MIFSCLLWSVLTFVQWNCENLFDCVNDSTTQDESFLPQADRQWTPTRYWKKVNGIAKTLVAIGSMEQELALPDFVALCEVENDSVLRDLTTRSLLRNARYSYVMTQSNDPRGMDVALLYNDFSFRLLHTEAIVVDGFEGQTFPTRDILYVNGEIESGDTLHIFVLHAPSKRDNSNEKSLLRKTVIQRLANTIDTIRRQKSHAKIVVMGDFNDTAQATYMEMLRQNEMQTVSPTAIYHREVKGSYWFQDHWEGIDQCWVTTEMATNVQCRIFDADFLLTADKRWGNKKPFRTYLGTFYQGGTSDHLPLVMTWQP